MNVYNNFQQEYKSKLKSCKEAVMIVKSGDYVSYGPFALFPRELDMALSNRSDELHNVKVRTMCAAVFPEIIKKDPKREHFIWLDTHFSSVARKAQQQQTVNYVPCTYHQWPKMNMGYTNYDVVFLMATPMDEQGFFNFGVANSETLSTLEKAKKIVIEVNENVPRCLGGNSESIHISKIDGIVESSNYRLLQIPNKDASLEEKQIANTVVKEIEDGSCIQLGIGALPNMVGSILSQSDLKDLGVHTEMMVDSYVDMYEAGRITNKKKNIDRGKIVYTFGLGTDKLYNFLHENPACASYNADYTNNPSIIAMNDKVVSINNAVEVDLFSQVSSESIGTSQISGTGGQLDYVIGSFNSNEGKSFICLTSTFIDKEGKKHSRIKSTFDLGTVVTVPRSLISYVVTEYGIAQMKGKSTWERAEALINISHPDFRDQLIKDAEKLKIWSYSNKVIDL